MKPIKKVDDEGETSELDEDQGEVDPTEPHEHHHKKHKRAKIIFLLGSVLLLVLAVSLIGCYVWQRKKLVRRLLQGEQRKVTLSDDKKVWTTPPDSTVAYLQAKGWRNPVYYALEDEAINVSGPKVDI